MFSNEIITIFFAIGIIFLAILGMAIGLILQNKVLAKGCGNKTKISCLLCRNSDCTNAGNKEIKPSLKKSI